MSKTKMKKINTTKTGKMVIAKYIRVSTDKQREEGYSIDIQKERLDAFAKSMFPSDDTHDVEYKEYVDDGYSGSNLDRPRMDEMIEDIESGKITHVIVVKLDRLSRSQKDTLHLIEDVFLPHNVTFISMGESFNTSTPFGRAVLGILSVFAQLERENIFERTRSGMQKRVELGYWPGGGRIPFGYSYSKDKGTLIPNKDADTVRYIYDLYCQGFAMQTIADICGLKYERLVYQVLTRKSNTGVITYNGSEYQGLHEPIISKETYERAMTMMRERSGKKFVSQTAHLLTGLVYCGKCNAKMRYQKWGNAGWKFVCYSQQNSKKYLIKDPNCDNIRPWADEVEREVLDIVFRRAKEVIDEQTSAEAEYNVLQVMQSQKKETEKKLRRLYNLYAIASDDTLLSTIQETQSEIAQLEERIQIETENSSVAHYAAEVQNQLNTLYDCWDIMTMQQKQNVLRSAINRVVVTDDHVHVDFNY